METRNMTTCWKDISTNILGNFVVIDERHMDRTDFAVDGEGICLVVLSKDLKITFHWRLILELDLVEEYGADWSHFTERVHDCGGIDLILTGSGHGDRILKNEENPAHINQHPIN
jgi:hypothetical protein